MDQIDGIYSDIYELSSTTTPAFHTDKNVVVLREGESTKIMLHCSTANTTVYVSREGVASGKWDDAQWDSESNAYYIVYSDKGKGEGKL